MPSKSTDVNVRIGFRSDTRDVENSLNKLKTSLTQLSKMKLADFKGTTTQFDDMKQTVQQIGIALQKSFNPTLNTTNISKFQNELQKSAGSLDQIYAKLSTAGPAGQVAFHQMATQVLTTNLQLKQTHSLIDSMGKTMMNTVKWGIASSVMNTFTQSVQGAFQYVQSLERSLTNIRIVTGDSTQEMARFAEQANRSAQALGRSTLDYTKSSLTFYQQGLDEEAVQARTEATLKAQNITGTGAEMADYLTSVWNGYKVANEEAELYVDKLAAVADSSASDMSQLAIAMSKVASTANTMGVDIDQLNAQIATVVATTRQAPESVGTAFKTIYTRMNDIKTGSDEAEISLGNYSGKMASLGINVLDATGHLRDTGQVMEQIGERWETMTRQQQVYLSTIMGGQRQVNQLMALFSNWTTYSELLNTSLEAQGTLNEKNARYMDSLGAKMEQLGAAGERVKDALINEDTVKGGVEALTSLVNLLGAALESIGGGTNALLALGAVATQVFGGTISREINTLFDNYQAKIENAKRLQQEIQATEALARTKGYEQGVITELVNSKRAAQEFYSVMSKGEIEQYNQLVENIAQEEQRKIKLEETVKVGEAFKKTLQDVGKIDVSDLGFGNTISDAATDAMEIVRRTVFNTKNNLTDVFQTVRDQMNLLANEVGSEKVFTGLQNYQQLKDALDSGNVSASKLVELFRQFATELGSTAMAASQTKQFNNELDLVNVRLEANRDAAESNIQSYQRLFNIKQATQFAALIGQIGFAVNNLANLGRIIKDEDLTAGQKLLKFFTNIGILAPTILNIVKSFQTLSQNEIKYAEAKLIKQQELNAIKTVEREQDQAYLLTKQLRQAEITLELEKQAAIETEKVRQQKIQQQNEKIALLMQQKKANLAKLELLYKREANTEDATQLLMIQTEISELEAANAKIDASIAGHKGQITKLMKPIASVLEAEKTVSRLTKALDALKNKTKGVGEVAGEATKAGAKGAEAGIGLVDALRGRVAGLISQLGAIAGPLLAVAAIAGGAYLLYKSFNYDKQQAEKEIKETERLKQKYDEAKDALKDLKSEIAQYDQAKSGLDQLVKGTEEWYDKVKELNSQVSELIEKFPILAKYIKGVDSNGIIQLEQGWEDALKGQYEKNQLASALTYLQQRQDSDKASEQSQKTNLGRDIYGLYDNRLPQVLKLLEQNNGTLDRSTLKNLGWNEDQIQLTIDHLPDIIELRNTLEQNRIETKALTDATIKATLAGKQEFANNKYSDAVADAYVYGIKQAQSQGLGDQYYKLNGQPDKNKIINDYNAATGESYSVGLFGDIKDGEGKKVPLDSVIEELVNHQVAEQYDQIFTQALENVENISKKYSSDIADVLLNNGFAGGKENIQLGSLSQAELEKIDPNALAQLWGIRPDQARVAIREIGESVSEGISDFVGNLDVTSQAVLTRLKLKGGLTEQVAEFIASDLQRVDNTLGPKAKGFIGNFYEKVFDESNLESGSNFISTFDFVSGSLEDFTKGLKQAGVATDEVTGQIEKYYNTQRQLVTVESKDLRVNPTNVAQGSQTASVFQKAASGENLSKEDLENIQDGVSNLLKMYPELTQDVKILSDTQLAGTSMYAESLRKLKMTLYDSYQAMSLSEAGFDADVLYSQISSLIVASEDLQAANIRGLLTEENFSSKLIELGSNYQNCKEDVEKYSAALRNHQDAIKETLNLEIALIAAEQSALYNLDPSTVEALAKSYSDAWAAQDGFNDNIYQNAELANDAAVAYLRLNEGIASLQSNYDDVAETLNVLANYDLSEILADEDLRKNFDLIQESVAGILNTSKDLVGEDFIKEYSKQILDAANGSEDAVKELMQAWGQQATENLPELPPIQLNLDNDEALQTLTFTKDQIQNFLNNLPQGQLSVDNLNAINNMIAAMQLAGMTAQEIQRYFADKQIDLDIGPASEAMQELLAQSADTGPAFAENISTDVQTNTETFSDTDEKQNVGMRGHWEPVYGWNVLPRVNAEMAGPLGGINYSPGNPLLLRVQGQQWVTQSPQVQTAEATNTTTATAIQAKAGNVRKGGSISHKNKTGGNRKHSSGGGKKGGGGGKSSQPKTPKTAKGVTTKIDPYRTVNNALKRTGSDLEKVRKEQEKLAGKDLIDNLTKQQKILDEQVDLQKEKLAIAKQERDTIASTLQQQGIGLQFDQNGTISNMEQALEQAAARANAEIARYNRMSAEQQEKDANKNIAKNAETWFKNIQTLLQNYDKLTEDTIPDLEKTIADQLEKQLELNLEKFNLQIDLSIDAGQASRAYNQFRKQIIDKISDDDILGIDKYLQEDMRLYQAENQMLDQHINEIRERINNMQNGLFDSVYGNNINQAYEDLAKYTDQAVDNLNDIEDKIKDIRDSIFDAIDQVEDSFDEQKDEYDYISDLIDHSRKLTEIRYGDDAYDLMDQLYERERENNNSLLEFQYGQTQLWYQKMLEARDKMNNATNAQDKENWEKQFKEYQKLYIDSQNELNSKFEDSIENIIDKYVNAINKVFDELDKRMTNGLGFDYIADEWDLINDRTDRYLDKVDALYEIDALDNAYQQAIQNAEGNPQAQRALNELMNTQLQYLRDKDKLTKYDVDRANALLDIETKRLALENSRNNKSKLRLRRDSQGNYTYQYVADDSDVNQAQQDLAKARRDLYDMTRDSYKDNLEDFQSTLTQMENDIKDVMADATLSEEQRWKKAKMLAQNYAPQIKDILSNLEVTKGFLPDDMVDSLSESLHEAIQLSDDDAETLLHTIVPQMTSTLADAAKYVRDQGIEGLVSDMFEGYQLASEALRKEMEQAERYVNQDLNELIREADDAILVAKQLLENNTRLIAENQDFIDQVNQQIAQGVKTALAATNTSLADTTLSALDAATAFDQLNASIKAAIMTLDPDYYNINNNKASATDVRNVNKSVNDVLNSGIDIASGATGMYTGSWGNEGRLAILHEKELLLNKEDTKNMLSAVSIVRTMDDLLKNIDFNNRVLNNTVLPSLSSSDSSLVDQNIHIEANFPNVSMQSEIEKAFEGLVNQAYQYAFRK